MRGPSLTWTVEVREAFVLDGEERGRWAAYSEIDFEPSVEDLEPLRQEYGAARAYDGEGREVTLMRNYTAVRRPPEPSSSSEPQGPSGSSDPSSSSPSPTGGGRP